MPRGNGNHAKQAKSSGKLSAFVKPKGEGDALMSAQDYPDWAEVNAGYMAGAVQAVVRAGGALLFGASQDKLMYSIRVYDQGQGTSYYFRCSQNGLEELEQFLLALMAIHDD